MEESAEDLYENAPCGYLSTAPGGLVVKVNRTFLEWTGFARDDLVGRRRFQDLLTAGGRIYHETHWAPLLHLQGHVREIAVDVVRADGTRLPVLVNATLRRDAEGRPIGTRTTVFNATDRKEYEQELLRARRRAERSEARLRGLQQVTATLAAAATTDTIAAAAAAAAVEVFEADAATVWLVDERDGRLRRVAVTGGEGADVGGASPAPDPAAAVLARDVVVGEAGAAVALPGAVRVVGVLQLGCGQPRRFDADELELLRALGRQTGQALERAALFEAERRRRAEAELMQRVGAAVAVASSSRAAARAVVAELVRAGIADRVAVGFVDPDTGRLGFAAAHGFAPDVLAAWSGGATAAPEGAAAAALFGRTPSFADADGADGSTEATALLPLVEQDRATGLLCLGHAAPRRFAPEERVFLSELAARAAPAIANARRYERERDVAHTLQRSLLAAEPPVDERFAVATHYRPAVETLEVGGDWHDAFLIDRDRLAVVVGDVVGRGLHAASAMGQLRSAIRALAITDPGPARLIERLDAYVEQSPAARTATVVYVEVDLVTGAMCYACAGHPPPVLAAPGEPSRLLWDGRSPPLGVRVPGESRDQAECRLAPGARLLLYTDGLVERRDRMLDEGLDRLVAELEARRTGLLPTLVAEVTAAMLADEETRDDVCLLCIELCRPSAGYEPP